MIFLLPLYPRYSILSNQTFIGLVSGKIQRKPSLLSKTRWFPAGLPLKKTSEWTMKYIICHNMPADKAWAKQPGTQDFSSSQMDDVVLSGGVEVRILRREVDLCFIWTSYGIQRLGSWKFMNCLSRFGKLRGLINVPISAEQSWNLAEPRAAGPFWFTFAPWLRQWLQKKHLEGQQVDQGWSLTFSGVLN